MWDATCLYLGSVPSSNTTYGASGAAASAEDARRCKYGTLGRSSTFVPFGVHGIPRQRVSLEIFLGSSMTLFETRGLAPILPRKLALPYNVVLQLAFWVLFLCFPLAVRGYIIFFNAYAQQTG